MTATDSRPATRVITALERRVLAVVGIAVLCALLFGVGLACEALNRAIASQYVPVSDHPLLILSVAMLMAQCSLGAIWWALARWPSHVKTLVAVAFCGITWALLVGLLETAPFEIESAAWACSLGIQAVLTALAMLVVDLVHRPERAGDNHRFSILFLLIWTAVIAILLGAGRWLSERLGWTGAIVEWQFFWQVQTIGVVNAALAVGLFVSLALLQSKRAKLVGCAVVTLAAVFGAPLLMHLLFTNVGVDLVDIAWLLTGEAMFFLATLGPLLALQSASLAQQAGSQEPAEPTALQIPPRLDSDR
jgi:hypothetical protein